MEPYHWMGKAWIAVARGKDGAHRGQVDGRYEHMRYTRSAGAAYHFVAVGVELGTVKMGVCVYEMHKKYSFKMMSKY